MTFLTLGFPTISKDSINQGYEFQHFGATDDFVEPKIYQKTPTKNRLNLGVSKKKKTLSNPLFGDVFFLFLFLGQLKKSVKATEVTKMSNFVLLFPYWRVLQIFQFIH